MAAAHIGNHVWLQDPEGDRALQHDNKTEPDVLSTGLRINLESPPTSGFPKAVGFNSTILAHGGVLQFVSSVVGWSGTAVY